jgi:hypothetical protein
MQPAKCTEGGVFVNGHWSVWSPPAAFYEITTWLLQHRGDYADAADPSNAAALDVMIHPLTDFLHLGSSHSEWSFWGGNAWPLNTAAYENGSGNGSRVKSQNCTGVDPL